MAYYNYPSNYPENLGIYQYSNQNYYNNYNHDYNNQEQRYVHQYSSNSEFYGNAYQQALTPPLVGYYYSNYIQPESVLTKDNASFNESGDYYDHVTTQYIVSYNNNTTAEAEEGTTEAVIFDENDSNPKPFHGGYDINEKYGKPLPASDDICYPSSKPDSTNAQTLNDFSYGNIPSPYVNGGKKDVGDEGEIKKSNGVIDSKVIQEENPSDFEDEDDEDEDEDEYDEEYEVEYDEEDEKEGGKKDDLVVEKNVNEAEPKQGNEIIPSKVIQVEKTSVFEGGEKKDELSKEPSNNIAPIIPLNVANHAKEAQDIKDDETNPKDGSIVSGGVIQEEKPPSDLEEGFEEEEDEEEEEEETEAGVGANNEIRRQIPPGYGMEAIDLCEGVFGGYFPCLWKRNQRIYNHERDANDKMNDYDYCWKETAEYLFGNPNPYGGTMPEKGSYGDPVYSYHRYLPQQPLTQEVQYSAGNSSWVYDSRY